MIALNTVVTYDLNSLPDYVQYTNKIKQQYCKKYKNCEYIFKSVNNLYNTDYLYKFSMCKDLIQQNKYTWIVIMDLDAVPCNFNINFQDWLNQQQKKIIIGKDCNGFNAGVVAIPCIDKSLLFLDRMFQLGKLKKYKWDQDIIIELINSEYKDFYIEPDKDFGFNNYINRFCKNINEFIFGKSFILHIPNPIGMQTPRLQNFKKIYEKLYLDCYFRTPIIGGRFGNILYGLLNNYIQSKKDNKKYVYVNSQSISKNLISDDIIDTFNLWKIYNNNINKNIKDNEISFVKENRATPCFAGFNTDFTEDQLKLFIIDIFLSSDIFKNIELKDNIVALNIRGGDYLSQKNNENYKFNFIKYLNIALQYFKNKNLNEIDIYSDDINYAKSYEQLIKQYNFKINYIENTTALSDFVNLSSYKNKILWNSTFSYWTAYISNVLFNDNYQDIIVPEYHVKWVNKGKAWQLNPKWNIVKDIA